MTSESSSHSAHLQGGKKANGQASRWVLRGIVVAVLLYLAAAAVGWPRQATSMILAADASHSHATTEDAAKPAHHNATDAVAEHAKPPAPPYFMVLPFAVLLGTIAVFPLAPGISHWWESNLHRFYVAGGLGGLTLLYYLLLHGSPVERHFLGHAVIEPAASGASFGLAWAVIQNAILNEFVPFIILLFSLYTISGGIRIEGDLRAHPLTNSAFLAIGGALASLIGTTGAAMLLIRPLLDTNHERKHVQHTLIFFIFIVCNCGGCLLPLGDPPLFLGYLQGVDFLWTLTLWKPWLMVNSTLIGIYFLWDHFIAYRRESKRDLARDESQIRRLRFLGLGLNGIWLLGVVLTVALLDPSKPVPGTDWHPWLYLREILMLLLVGCSLATGATAVRRANNFNYGAIIEVAVLFLGIFLCMQPALQILDVKGASLGIDTPQKFFWATGALSSVLDNAPTYLVFFKTAQVLDSAGSATMAGVAVELLAAISLGAVFMGAMTYIGNGPNFMVKAIAETAGVRMPSFFGYMAYSVVVLLPVLVVATLLFI